MKCPKCGYKLYSDEKYCNKCGYQVFRDKKYENEYLLSQELLTIYLDNKKYGIFSLYYILFNWFYLFYKELYFHGVISFFVTNILINCLIKVFSIISSGIPLYLIFLIILCLILIVFYSFNINGMYIDNCNKKINKILFSNKDKTNDELKQLIDKEPKVNYLVFSLLSLTTVIFVILFYF